MSTLEPEEQRRLAEAERVVSADLPQAVTFAALLATWDGVADEVGTGFDGTIDDYTNDLDGRELIEEILRAVPAGLRAKLQGELDPVDERFRVVTEDDAAGAVAAHFRIGEGWWWRRIPRAGALADTL